MKNNGSLNHQEFHLPMPPNEERVRALRAGRNQNRSGGDVELGRAPSQGSQGQPTGNSTAGMARAGSAQPGLQIVTIDRAGSSNQGEIAQQGMMRAGSAQAGTIQAGPTPKIVIGEGPSASGGFARYSLSSGEISPMSQSVRVSLDAQPGTSHPVPRRTGERKKYASHMGKVLDRELIRIERRGQDLAFKRAKGAEAMDTRECRVCLSTDEQAKIISACKCSGTQQWTHYGCLRHWVLEKRTLKCELCGADYAQPYFDSLREELEKLPPRGQQDSAPQGPQDYAFGVPMGTFDPNLGYITYDRLPPGATRPDPTFWPQRLPPPRYALEGPAAGRITVGVVLCASVCAFIIIVAVAARTGGGAGGD